MYAVISTGGKQYRVEQGQRLLVERLGDVDSDVELKTVMLVMPKIKINFILLNICFLFL